MSRPITARIPAVPEHVHVLRTVVAAVATRAGGSVDDLADLRLLVDEAATLLLRSAAGSTALAMSIDPGDGSLEISLSADERGVDVPRDGLPWRVMQGLADSVETGSTADGPAIRIRRRLGAG
jgi:serine/threonine-protein kinase RsbW